MSRSLQKAVPRGTVFGDASCLRSCGSVVLGKKHRCRRPIGLGDDPERRPVGRFVGRHQPQALAEGGLVRLAVLVVEIPPIAASTTTEAVVVDFRLVDDLGRRCRDNDPSERESGCRTSRRHPVSPRSGWGVCLRSFVDQVVKRERRSGHRDTPREAF